MDGLAVTPSHSKGDSGCFFLFGGVGKGFWSDTSF